VSKEENIEEGDLVCYIASWRDIVFLGFTILMIHILSCKT